jgi:hypothetical protein
MKEVKRRKRDEGREGGSTGMAVETEGREMQRRKERRAGRGRKTAGGRLQKKGTRGGGEDNGRVFLNGSGDIGGLT